VSVLMGAFLVYFSETRILLWYWFLARSCTVRIAAYLVLPLWLGEQVVYAYLQRAEPGISNVGYAAHIGGFVFGLGLALLAKRVLRIGSDEA
jgi:membrane associated rhomboid family serine protease